MKPHVLITTLSTSELSDEISKSFAVNCLDNLSESTTFLEHPRVIISIFILFFIIINYCLFFQKLTMIVIPEINIDGLNLHVLVEKF